MNKIATFFYLLFLMPLFTVAQDLPAGNSHQTKAQKRFIHPKSKYFVASFGWAFTGNRVTDPTGYSRNGMHYINSSFIPEVRYEHGLVENYFLELGFARYDRPIIQEWAASNDYFFAALTGGNFHNEINLGLGYRIMIGKKNFNLINFHGGIFFAWSANMSFSEGEVYRQPVPSLFVNNDEVVYQYAITDKNNHFGAYLGVSKDLRLSQSVLLFGKYTYRLGFSHVTAGSIDVFVNSNPSGYEPGRFEIGLGGHFITTGLKILIHKP